MKKITLVLTGKTQDAVKELLRVRNEAIKTAINDLQAELEGNESALVQLNGYTAPEVIDAPGYRADFTWMQKTEYALKRFDKPATAAEIINEVFSIEPALTNSRASASSSISSVLGKLAKLGSVERTENELGSFLYKLLKSD